MDTKNTFNSIATLGIGLTTLALLLAGCSGGGASSSDSGGIVSGVATPSKVSVVNTN